MNADRKHQRERVYAAIWHAKKRGLTDQECQERLDMSPQTQCPRRLELEKDGVIQLNGQCRKTRAGNKARVWVAKAHVK